MASPHPPGADLGLADRPSLSIADLYGRVDRALRAALPGQVWVAGEVRSFNVSSRGHCYIDLVDPAGKHDTASPVLKVVCWSSRWSRVRTTLDQLGITLDAGLLVRVRGEVQLYKPRGDISFILSEFDTDALLGKLAAERARVIKAMTDEGLLDRNRSVAVPAVPLRVGLVASPGTEGYRDFLGQLEASGLGFDVRVVATPVQGKGAHRTVARAITALGSADRDLVVVVRGGGSKADLAAFDTEMVARAVATSPIPVWTGIGHTGDQSVADEVANRSFITPTECGQELARRAELCWAAAMEAGEVVGRLAGDVVAGSHDHLGRARRRLATGARMQLGRHGDRLAHRASAVRGVVQGQLDVHGQRLSGRGAAIGKAAIRSLEGADRSLVRRATLLAALPGRRLDVDERQATQWRRLMSAYDYQRQLERGYSVTRDASGAVVRSVASVRPGYTLITEVTDGSLRSVVTDDEIQGDPVDQPPLTIDGE
ncbi:MAG: exodeoxyribonuclease VII large subunit [Acidimicrobiales bacterium]